MKLYLLKLGTCEVDKGMVLTPGSGDGERITIPIAAFVIETDDGRHILVDTGMHRKHIYDPEATFRGRRFSAFVSPQMAVDDDIVSRLAEIELTPRDIDILVSTHFHFDHAGNHADFAHARIVTQRACLEYAKEHPDLFPPDIWDLPELRYELIDGDCALAPGVELLATPGHVPGHMSVVVRLAKTGTVVIAIDAIYTWENLETDNWQGQVDPAAGKRSAARLRDIAEAEAGFIITGHDSAAWVTLRHAPASYD